MSQSIKELFLFYSTSNALLDLSQYPPLLQENPNLNTNVESIYKPIVSSPGSICSACNGSVTYQEYGAGNGNGGQG